MNAFVTISLLLIAATGLNGEETRLTLTGRILNDAGEPATNATVFVYSAGPRHGAGQVCPTCYPDCRKSARADGDGKFLIEHLDPSLLFRLLVVDNGFKPQFAPRTDPAKSPIEIKLARRPGEFPKNQVLQGNIVDPDGRPVSRAVVSFDFFSGLDANCGGECEGVDFLAVTDNAGAFALGSEKRFETMTVLVDAPGFAKQKFFALESAASHRLRLTRGATVSGRVRRVGKAAKNIGIGLASVDKGENFTGAMETVTDNDGNFIFFNVPAFDIYYVYSLMDRSGDDYHLPIQKLRVREDESRKDLGELAMERGVRIKGRVRLSDALMLPAHTEIFLSRYGAWDWRLVTINPDGSFETSGLPKDAYSLGINLRGYQFSDLNKSLDRLNGSALVGRIDESAYLDIWLEPAAAARPARLGQGPEATPYDRPLQGIIPDAR